jgi:hypothetical protein
MNTGNIWTTDMIVRFTELHRQKPELMFCEIAAAMSADFNLELTKNACIGKARRLGLPSREGIPRQPVKGREKMIRKSVDAPIPPIEIDQPIEAAGLTIYQLRDGDCKWPLAQVEDYPPYLYCGEPTDIGCSWCYEHRERVYNKPRVTWA